MHDERFTKDEILMLEIINNHPIFNKMNIYIDMSFHLSSVMGDDTLEEIFKKDKKVEEFWRKYGDIPLEDEGDRCVSEYFDKNGTLIDRLKSINSIASAIYAFKENLDYVNKNYSELFFVCEPYMAITEENENENLEFEIYDIDEMIDFLMGRIIP